MVFGPFYLAREWVRAGHSVTIIAADYAHTRFAQPARKKQVTEEYIEGIRYVWIPTPAYKPSDRLGRILNMFSFALKVWFKTIPVNSADVVICSSPQPFSIFAAHRCARRFSAKLIFEVRDLWPLTLIELGGAGLNNPFIKLMQWTEDYAYRHSDLIVSVLNGAKDYMVEHGMAPEKFIFIPNGIDSAAAEQDDPLPEPHSDTLKQIRSKNCFIIGYAGRVGLANALYLLLDAVALCNEPDICIAILGEGSHVVELKIQAERLGMADRVFFLKSVRKNQVRDFLSQVDVAYIGLQKKPLFRFGVSPNKLNDYMLAAKPIIYAVNGSNNIVSISNSGVSCPGEDPKAVSNAISALKSLHPAERAEMGERGRKWILNNHDYRFLAGKYFDAITSSDSL